MAVGAAGVGVVFGAVQTGLAAHFDSLGTPAVSGTVYACLGIGSAVAGLLTTRIPATVPLSTRMAASGLALAAASLLPRLVHTGAARGGLHGCRPRGGPGAGECLRAGRAGVPGVRAHHGDDPPGGRHRGGVSAAPLGGWLAEAHAPGAAFAVASAAGTVAAASGWASRRPERR